jgi:hypothetical protein
MAGEDFGLADTFIGEEAIDCFRVCPILASHGKALAHGAIQSFEQPAQPLGLGLISKHASREGFACGNRSLVETVGADYVPPEKFPGAPVSLSSFMAKKVRRSR